MSKSKILLAISLVGTLAIGWQLNEVVSAKSAAQKVCLTAFGTAAKRTACLAGETELASGKVRTTPIKKRKMPKGKTRLVSKASASMPTAANTPDMPLVATLGSSVRSYTYVLGFSTDWRGELTTSCSDMEVPTNAYVTYFLDGQRISATPKPGTWSAEGNGVLVHYSPLPGETDKYMNLYFDVGNWTSAFFTGRMTTVSEESARDPYAFDRGVTSNLVAIPSGLTVYVTQLCAPLMTLENAG